MTRDGERARRRVEPVRAREELPDLVERRREGVVREDAEVELDIATTARELPSGDLVALNNSFGFGGANVAVAFATI